MLLFKWMIGLMLVVTGIIAMDNLSTAVLLFGVCYLLMLIGNVKLIRLLKIRRRVALILLFVLLLNVIPDGWTNSSASRLGTWQNRIEHFGSAKNLGRWYFTITDDNYQVTCQGPSQRDCWRFPGNSTERDFPTSLFTNMQSSLRRWD